MFRRSVGLLLLAALTLVLAVPDAPAQKKDAAGAKAIDSGKFAAGEYTGIVRSSPGDDRVFTIEIPSTQMVATGGARRVGSVIVPSTRAKTIKYEVEFQASSKAKVRTLVLPEQFDDKGKPKKYTAKQLAELKGKDTHLPGYESSLEKLESGQVVRVTLRPAPPPPAKAKAKDKDAAEAAAKDEKKMQATLIVILKEGDGGSSAAGPPKKKN